MLLKLTIILAAFNLISLTAVVFGLFDQCIHTVDLKAGHKIFLNSPLYPNPYPADTSCRYTLRAPLDYQLNFKCNIDIEVTPAVSTAQLTERCYDEIFYFNREGSELLSGSEYFCGHGSMERNSFLNRAVISYISTRPMRGQIGAGVKGVTKSGGTQGGGNTSNTHYSTTTPPPIFATTSSPIGISNAFAYFTKLLSNSIETSISIAPPPSTPPTKLHKKKKRKGQRRKATKPTRRLPKPATSTDLLSFTWEPSLSNSGRNGSIQLPPIPKEEISNLELKQSINVTQNDFRIVSYQASYEGYPAGSGKGRFSCLVEAVESQCDCGWSTYSLKVVSPSGAAGVNEFTSMAGVLTVNYGKIFCGAVIIHRRYLLSAAHCFLSDATNRSDLIQIVVGEHDLSTVLESVYTRYYDLETIILHENFRSTSTQLRNDIALLRTRQTIEFNRGVAPACLPFRSITGTDGGRQPPIAEQRVETAGWGSISFGGPQSSLLLTAQLDVIGAEECRGALGALPPATFCTFTPGRDTCQYDSGGGLYMREGGRLTVVGIVSYGYGCAARRPSVNTRVASFIRWIKSKTSQVTYCIK